VIYVRVSSPKKEEDHVGIIRKARFSPGAPSVVEEPSRGPGSVYNPGREFVPRGSFGTPRSAELITDVDVGLARCHHVSLCEISS
jgi:hypothetical protein